MPYPLTTHYICPVSRGATLPQLFKVDGISGICLVKFLENPQGPRALPNELIGFRIADHLGLEHPEVGVVKVDADTLPDSGQLLASNRDIYGNAKFTFGPGLAFYSRWLDPKDEVFASDVRGIGVAVNPKMLAGVVVLDLLLGNTDRKPKNTNLILHRESTRQHLKLIDLGMAFGNANWEIGNLRDTDLPPLTAPLPYSIPPVDLLDTVNPVTDFAPYLAKLQSLNCPKLEAIMSTVPSEWGITAQHRAALVDYVYTKAQQLPTYLATRAATRTKKWWQ